MTSITNFPLHPYIHQKTNQGGRIHYAPFGIDKQSGVIEGEHRFRAGLIDAVALVREVQIDSVSDSAGYWFPCYVSVSQSVT